MSWYQGKKEGHMSPIGAPIGIHPPQQPLLTSMMKSDSALPEAELQGSKSHRPAYKIPFHLFLAEGPRTNSLSFLGLGFSIYKTGITIVPTL